MTTATHRIRRCNGNRAAWCLVRLRADGSESDSYGSYVTDLSLDGLLERAGPIAGVVELVL